MEKFIYGTDYATIEVINYDVSDEALAGDCPMYDSKKIACLYIIEASVGRKVEVIGSVITCVADNSEEAENIDYYILGAQETKDTLSTLDLIRVEVCDNTEDLDLSIHHVTSEQELVSIKKLFDDYSGDMYIQYREDGFKQNVNVNYESDAYGFSDDTTAWLYDLFESWHMTSEE